MKNIDLISSLISAILGAAYPILLQVITKIDDTYSSSKIIKLLENEKYFRLFKYSLYASITFVFIRFFEFKPLYDFGKYNRIIGNSASILLGITSVLLIFFFFKLINKILVYSVPEKICDYLISEHNKINRNRKFDEIEFKYIKAYSDILKHVIRRENFDIIEKSRITILNLFAKIRENEEFHRNIKYPQAYYEIISQITEDLAIKPQTINYRLESLTCGNLIYLGGMPGDKISNSTYAWMWHNLNIVISNKRIDLAMNHWYNAHEYIRFSLEPKPFNYSSDYKELLNKDEINARNEEREKFKRFHYFLGGLIMHMKLYKLIKQTLNHTMSQPPDWPLLANSMDEIFYNYFRINNIFDPENYFTSFEFPFQNIKSGINGDREIRTSVSEYFIVLYLRIFNIQSFIYTYNPLQFPRIPEKQSEKTRWLNSLEFFKERVIKINSNTELINELGFKSIYSSDDSNDPLTYIDKLKELIIQEHKNVAENIIISDEKKQEFYKASNLIISEAISNSNLRIEKKTSNAECKKWFIQSNQMFQEKEALSENSEISHLNFESYLANNIKNDIIKILELSFITNIKKTYIFRNSDIYNAIKRIKGDTNIIVYLCGIVKEDIVNDDNEYPDAELQNGSISYVNIPSINIRSQCIFIIEEGLEPYIEIDEVDEKSITRYNLEKISDSIDLYASILDLKVRDDIKSEYTENHSVSELNKKALMSIFLNLSINWISSSSVTQIIKYNEYDNLGIPNKLNEISV